MSKEKASMKYFIADTPEKICEIIEPLHQEGLINYHHTACGRSYIRKNTAEIYLYTGRYGKGLVVKYNMPGTTQYCNLEYWIMDEAYGPSVYKKIINALYGAMDTDER